MIDALAYDDEVEIEVDTPEVFEPLWTSHARYKGAWGGRGSAKSNDRAQAVIAAMVSEPGVRIACLREVQKSIKDSSRQLLIDWIQRYKLGPLFDVVETEIRGPDNSLCIFRGMAASNPPHWASISSNTRTRPSVRAT